MLSPQKLFLSTTLRWLIESEHKQMTFKVKISKITLETELPVFGNVISM